MAGPSQLVGQLIAECDKSPAVLVESEQLRSLLEELCSLRRQVVGRAPPIDPRVEQRIKSLEEFVKGLEKDVVLLMEGFNQLRAGASSAIAAM